MPAAPTARRTPATCRQHRERTRVRTGTSERRAWRGDRAVFGRKASAGIMHIVAGETRLGGRCRSPRSVSPRPSATIAGARIDSLETRLYVFARSSPSRDFRARVACASLRNTDARRDRTAVVRYRQRTIPEGPAQAGRGDQRAGAGARGAERRGAAGADRLVQGAAGGRRRARRPAGRRLRNGARGGQADAAASATSTCSCWAASSCTAA